MSMVGIEQKVNRNYTSREEIGKAVLNTINTWAEENRYTSVDMNSRLGEMYDFDLFNNAELFLELEESFKITFSDFVLDKIFEKGAPVKDLADYVSRLALKS